MKELAKLDLKVVEMMRHGRNSSLTLSDNTIPVYVTAGKQFNEFLKANNYRVNEISIRRFFEAKSKDWSRTTANLKRQALMKLIQNQDENSDSYISMAAVREMFKRNVARTKQISQAIVEGKYLTEDEVKEVIKQSTVRTGLIIEFLFVTGCRVSEMITIKNHDLEKGESYRIKIVGKGDKQRVVFASAELIKTIKKEFDGKVYLFETSGRRTFNRANVGKVIAQAGWKVKKNLYPHILRHSCAMHLKESGKKTPDYIQRYLGHADVATTLRFYFHHEPKAEVVNCFHLR